MTKVPKEWTEPEVKEAIEDGRMIPHADGGVTAWATRPSPRVVEAEVAALEHRREAAAEREDDVPHLSDDALWDWYQGHVS